MSFPKLLAAFVAIVLATPIQAHAVDAFDHAPPLRADPWFGGYSWSDYPEGKVSLVYFWATWCMPCVGSTQRLQEIQDQHLFP